MDWKAHGPHPQRLSPRHPPHPWSFEVARAIGLPGALRAGLEPWLQHRVPDPDGPLGPFLRDRVGAAVFNRLVDPLLGGVYAGSARQLSIGAVAPQLLQAMDRNVSLLRGLRRVQPPASDPTARPSFITLREGLAQLPTALARALPSGSLRLSSRVTRLLPSPGGGVSLALTGLEPEEFDGVVIAIPAPRPLTSFPIYPGTSRWNSGARSGRRWQPSPSHTRSSASPRL